MDKEIKNFLIKTGVVSQHSMSCLTPSPYQDCKRERGSDPTLLFEKLKLVSEMK